MATNVIARRTLQAFWMKHSRAKAPLSTWYQVFSRGDWRGPADIKSAFGSSVDFIGDNRVIFDIGGNKYRLIVHIAYPFKTALIKFVGTHRDYDRIDPETV